MARLAHPAIPATFPGAVTLTAYSVDADRIYAFERDRLAKQWETLATDLTATVSVFDLSHDPGELARARAVLGQMVELTEQARHLPEPAKPEKTSADLAMFRTDFKVRAAALAKAFEGGEEYCQMKADRRERATKIKENAAAGLPWNHGLDRRLTTFEDYQANPSMLDGLDGLAKASEIVRMKQRSRRLTGEDPGFNLSDRMTEATAGTAKTAELLTRTLGNGEHPRLQGAVEPVESSTIGGLGGDAA